MAALRFDLLGIGNAIVDVVAHADEDFLRNHSIRKGTVALIDEPRAEALYQAIGPAIEVSGGSAANTVFGAAGFGASTAFIGKVKDDVLGRVFTHDIRAAGVTFDTPAAADGPSTGRCYVLVTPDGERALNTYLGAAQGLQASDLDPDAIGAAAITYLEGHLWGPENANNAFLKAAEVAHNAGRMVALTLSDSTCVDRWREDFKELIRLGTIDFLLANEAELHGLYQTADFDTAFAAFRQDARYDLGRYYQPKTMYAYVRPLAVVTRGEKGCLIITRESTRAVHAVPVERVVDMTGAGDLFAAGFLFGLARELETEDAARLGAIAAAEVIQHLGARPETSLKELARDSGLLD